MVFEVSKFVSILSMDNKFYKDNKKEIESIKQKIQRAYTVGFPIEKIYGQYDSVSYEFMIIYKNEFWVSIYTLCEIFKCSEFELTNIIEEISLNYLYKKEPIKIECITFYPVNIVLKLSEELHSELGMKICKDFLNYPVNKDRFKLNDFLWLIYEQKENIFSQIVLTAYNTIETEMNKYNANLHNKFINYADKIYHAKYAISTLDFLRISVWSFIGYMYIKYQQTNNLYQQTKEYLQSDSPLQSQENDKTDTSAYTTDKMSSLKNAYNKLKEEFNSPSDIFQTKDDFEHINIHARDREKPVSKKISENGKKVSSDRVLLRHEYALYRYKSGKKYNNFFLLAKKISNGTIVDNNHYTNGDIADAFTSMTQLYKDIINDIEMHTIDKCMLLDDLESRYKIEMFYKWLKALKDAKSLHRNHLDDISTLYAMWINVGYEKSYFPYESFSNISYPCECIEQGTAMTNTLYYGCDRACEYYACHMDSFEQYLDFIIAFNVMRQHVVEVLENEYASKMMDFEYYDNTLLNEFLNDFIGQGQHINFDKHPYEDINIKDLRYIYQQIIPKNK